MWIALLVVLLLLLVGCRTDSTDDPGPLVSPTDLAGRWNGIPEGVQEEVCAAAEQKPAGGTVDTGSGQIPAQGPDWQGMLEVLVFNGMQRGDAAALLPYAANQCV
jgi:hypothetical protein